MKRCRKEKASFFLLLIMLLATSHIVAEEPPSTSGNPAAQTGSSSPVPELPEVIPLAAELSGRLAELEQKVPVRLDIPSLQKKYADIEKNLQDYSLQLQQLKGSDDYKSSKLLVLKQQIDHEHEKLDIISKSVNKEVSRLATRRKEWLTRKQNWDNWQSVWIKNGVPDRLYPIFDKINQVIEQALNLIAPRMDTMLAEQEHIGAIQEKIYSLTAELNKLIEVKQIDTLLDTSPPMFTYTYFSQFGVGFGDALWEGIHEMTRLSAPYIGQLGVSLLIQAVIFTIMSVLLCRNRQLLNQSARWRFLAMRPFSSTIFCICVITILIFEYEGAPPLRKLVNEIIGGIVFIRIVSYLTDVRWKKQFVVVLITLVMITRSVHELNFPLPLSRLYITLAGLSAALFCRRWARECKLQEGQPLLIGLLQLGMVFNACIVVAQIFGKDALSGYLFMSVIRSLSVVLVYLLLIHIIHGGLEWLFRVSPVRQVAMVYSADTDVIILRVRRFIGFLMVGLVVFPGILMIWGLYPNLNEATRGIWSLGFSLGTMRITVSHVIVAISIILGSFIISRIFQVLFLKVMLRKGHIERGVRLSIERLIHYIVLCIGFFLVISLLGFELTKFTIILSALGVGIGFGLQSVVNNFVSGLILLFERPVREGDTIEIGGMWAEVKRIGLRATTVQTLDQADLIVPNADLATQQVTNWTLSSRQVRLIIPVGVAYGSDVGLVFETLLACAKENPKVSKVPEPEVLFLKFGESSLEFELRVWVDDAAHRLILKSDLHREIDRRFREANIVIAFPQRDLHLKSVDKTIDFSTT